MERCKLKDLIFTHLHKNQGMEPASQLYEESRCLDKILLSLYKISKEKNGPSKTFINNVDNIYEWMGISLEVVDYDIINEVFKFLQKRFEVIYEGKESIYAGRFISVSECWEETIKEENTHIVTILPMFENYQKITFCHEAYQDSDERDFF